MHYPGYDTGNITLSEGKWFPFRIHNLVQLQDDAWYYVLLDINGLKHFMAAEFYESYGFKPGDEISCKIDRINCTGRIYLEPEHPVYKEGKNYYFEVISMPDLAQEKVLVVKEISGNSIEVPVYFNIDIDIKDGKMVCCVVKSIKKGRVILEITDSYS